MTLVENNLDFEQSGRHSENRSCNQPHTLSKSLSIMMSGLQRSQNYKLRPRQPGAEHNGGRIAKASKASNTSSGTSRTSVGMDHLDDSSNQRLSRLRPLARLDRLLRRWLPGYSYLRRLAACASNSSSDSPRTSSLTAPMNAAEQHKQREQEIEEEIRAAVSMPHGSGLPYNRKRRSGEVVLDAGIAKSEFCQKLEKLLRAKLNVKNKLAAAAAKS